MAGTHSRLGYFLLETGRLKEAEAEYRGATAVEQKLVDDYPNVAYFQNSLADSRYNFGRLLSKMGKAIESEVEFGKAIAIRQKLADDNPGKSDYQSKLALSLSYQGVIQQHKGQISHALALFRSAIAVMERLPTPTPLEIFERACYQSRFAGAAAERGSGLTATEARVGADQAMETLRRAAIGGYRNRVRMQTDSNLDTLRNRADFQILLMDLAMPADPFVRTSPLRRTGPTP